MSIRSCWASSSIYTFIATLFLYYLWSGLHSGMSCIDVLWVTKMSIILLRMQSNSGRRELSLFMIHPCLIGANLYFISTCLKLINEMRDLSDSTEINITLLRNSITSRDIIMSEILHNGQLIVAEPLQVAIARYIFCHLSPTL